MAKAHSARTARKGPTNRKPKFGLSISGKLQARVRAMCKRQKPRWIYSHYTEAALRLMLCHDILWQEVMVRNYRNEEFWSKVEQLLEPGELERFRALRNMP